MGKKRTIYHFHSTPRMRQEGKQWVLHELSDIPDLSEEQFEKLLSGDETDDIRSSGAPLWSSAHERILLDRRQHCNATAT